MQKTVNGKRAKLEKRATRMQVMGGHVCVLLDNDAESVYYGLTITFRFVTLTINDRQECR